MYLHAKFDVFSSNRSRDMEGVPKLQSTSRDPFPTPFDLILHFLLLLLVMYLHAKFDVSSSNRSRDLEGVPKLQK